MMTMTHQVVFGILGTSFFLFLIQHFLMEKQSSARVEKQGSSPLLGRFVMEYGYWLIKPIGTISARLSVSPHFFSLACLVLGAIGAYCTAVGDWTNAGLMYLLSAACDLYDGMVARLRNLASDAGEVLDAAIDRYTECFFIMGISFHVRDSAPLLLLSLVALLGSYMVTFSQAKADAMNLSVPKGWMRRPERAIYLGLGTFLIPLLPTEEAQTILLTVILSLVSFFGNVSALHRFWIMFHQAGKKT